jgi:hypothetical protein
VSEGRRFRPAGATAPAPPLLLKGCWNEKGRIWPRNGPLARFLTVAHTSRRFIAHERKDGIIKRHVSAFKGHVLFPGQESGESTRWAISKNVNGAGRNQLTAVFGEPGAEVLCRCHSSVRKITRKSPKCAYLAKCVKSLIHRAHFGNVRIFVSVRYRHNQ